MADKDYKAFIVEGEAREPQVIDNISKVFFNYGTGFKRHRKTKIKLQGGKDRERERSYT